MTTTAPPMPPVVSGRIPPSGSRLRVVLTVVGVAVVFVIVAVVVFAVTRTPERPLDYLSPTSGSPDGTRALVEVLRDQGVDVETMTTLDDVRRAAGDPTETTIVVFDAYLVLGGPQREALLDEAEHVVVLDPYDIELEDFAPGVVMGTGGGFAEYDSDCTLPAAEKAESVAVNALDYDVSDAESDVLGCFSTDDDAYAVVQTTTRGTRVTLVGVSPAFTNGQILEAGNAAFALNLLGEHETLVWYTPDLTELDSGEIPSAVNLTPPWVTPLIILALVLALVAAVWRGRRIGPLVAERLPVIVRANETMEGRARLYERAGARGHALDSLRIGTIARLATLCGLPRRSTVHEIVAAVAALTGRDKAALSALLVDAIPPHDGALVQFSDDLLRLEADVSRIVRGR